MRIRYFIVLCFFVVLSVQGQQPHYRLQIDSTTHQYTVISTGTAPNNLLASSDGVSMYVNQNALRPHTALDITLHFSAAVDLNLLDFFFFSATYECDQPQVCGSQLTRAYLSSKSLDRASRTVRYTMDGLMPEMRYKVTSIVFGLDGPPCGSSHSYGLSTTTAPEPKGTGKKLLLVVNKEWEHSEVLNQALDQYIRDIRLTADMEIEKYYIGSSAAEKTALYEHVQQQYFENSLSYLFFVGRNASVPTYNVLLNRDKQVIAKYYSPSFTWYTNVWNNSFILDPQTNEFVSKKYQDVCYRAPEEIRNPVFQEDASAISVGMLLPNTVPDQHQMIQSVVAYFDKLHRYKNREIEFDRKILSSDGFYSEAQTISNAKALGRWNAVDTVKYGRIKDYHYSGYDSLWKEDYLSKLQNKSYEILNYNGHGSPTHHSFGINSSDVSGMNSLNTQILNFYSCNIGNFETAGYLADLYLGKGNVLAVHAYSDVLVQIGTIGKSFLSTTFNPLGPYGWMSKGYTLSDAFRYGSGYIGSEVILGDPLLKLREVCGSVIESQASGEWHDQATWTCGRIPTKNDVVRILPAHTIRLMSKGEAKEITIEGNLDLSAAGKLEY